MLKQQVQQFSHATKSRQYRNAKRAYERGCYKTKTVETKTTQIKPNVAPKTTLQQKIEPVLIEPISSSEAEVLPNEVEVLPIDNNAEQTGTKEVEAIPVEVVPIDDKKLNEQKSVAAANANKAQVNQKAINLTPNKSNDLLDVYLLPSLLLLGVCILAAFVIFYIKPRKDKLKENIKQLKSKAEKVKSSIPKKSDITKNGPLRFGPLISSKKPVIKKRKKDELDREIYKSFKHLVLRLENKQLEKVERITVSQYGIFVIESQRFSGDIFGGLNSAKWTSKTQDNLVEFDNPIQLVKQKSTALSKFLDSKENFQLIVLFDDSAVFKAPMPAAVMHRKKLNAYIKSFKELIYSDEQCEAFNLAINEKVNSDWAKGQKQDEPHKAPALDKVKNETKKVQENISRIDNSPQPQPQPQPQEKPIINKEEEAQEGSNEKHLSLEETLNSLSKNEAHLPNVHPEEQELPQNKSPEEAPFSGEEESFSELPSHDDFLSSLEMPEQIKDDTAVKESQKQQLDEEFDEKEMLAELEKAKKEMSAYLNDDIGQVSKEAVTINETGVEKTTVTDNLIDINNEDIKQSDETSSDYLEKELEDNVKTDAVEVNTHVDGSEVDIVNEDIKQTGETSSDYLEKELEANVEVDAVEVNTCVDGSEVEIVNEDIKQADEVLSAYLEKELEVNIETDAVEVNTRVDGSEVEIVNEDIKQADEALSAYLEKELEVNIETDETIEVTNIGIDTANGDIKQADEALSAYLEKELEGNIEIDTVETVNIDNVDISSDKLLKGNEETQENIKPEKAGSDDVFSNLSLDPTWDPSSSETPINPTLKKENNLIKDKKEQNDSIFSNMQLDPTWDPKTQSSSDKSKGKPE
ncbi:NERD domain-containing protein [Pseudoalteromonas denitrificans]|uniref:NERD domain-containing protein n=1 Tax=Pseudoalteromonas denitrificans TaxID=43656 RepID=UPI0015A5BD3B|nr:NERD domain-containing protein [Pseudoalteromonas denitrificans]